MFSLVLSSRVLQAPTGLMASMAAALAAKLNSAKDKVVDVPQKPVMIPDALESKVDLRYKEVRL